ncbi:hypothetical protein WBG06_19415 [Nocardioides sp. CCNWLW239]|uniref:hypothetical protein n=1 Tax=Nocardioides sp. CCNWLW239 TaxID=3128902 RepID=UPI003018D2F4
MTSARDARTLLASAALAMLLTAAITACGTPSDAPSEGSTPSSTAALPTESGSPTAAWQTADAKGATVQIPPDWSQDWDGASILFKPPADSTGFDVARTVFVVKPGLWEGTPGEINSLGDDELSDTKSEPGVRAARRLPDLKVNGATLFHIRAEDETNWIDVFGTLNGSERTTVAWQISKGAFPDRKEADAMIDPVMQTFTLS